MKDNLISITQHSHLEPEADQQSYWTPGSRPGPLEGWQVLLLPSFYPWAWGPAFRCNYPVLTERQALEYWYPGIYVNPTCLGNVWAWWRLNESCVLRIFICQVWDGKRSRHLWLCRLFTAETSEHKSHGPGCPQGYRRANQCRSDPAEQCFTLEYRKLPVPHWRYPTQNRIS